MRFLLLALLSFLLAGLDARAQETSIRQTELLNGPGWQFLGAGAAEGLPAIGTDAFNEGAWTAVTVPHIFQTRANYDTLTKGWYRRRFAVDPSSKGKEIYLIFEGAASIADVYVNGQHLGQHRGAYTRFVFDATKALHTGSDNELAVLVDDTPANTLDCLPISVTGLYKIWGGLYRNVWLVTTAPLHIDPTDYAAPGVYLTPKNVSAASAGLNIRVLLRNTYAPELQAEVRSRILDPSGNAIQTLATPATIPGNGRAAVELSTLISHPQLWEPLNGRLYKVETTLYYHGKPVDEVTESTGFRWLQWDWQGGTVTVNGKRVILYGADLHQETETKGSAVAPEDLEANFNSMKDLGINFLRLPHYPHARLEYDLADRQGILCWAENGHSNGKDMVSPTAAQITTELVKQNYNHPSIVLWSVGNESSAPPADECVPIVKALDPSRIFIRSTVITAGIMPIWIVSSQPVLCRRSASAES
jgi:beta-galactosidase